MRLPRWLRLALGVIADVRDVSRELDRHPHRLMTERDRARSEEHSDAHEFRVLAGRRRDAGNVAGAVEPYEQLLAARVRALGEDHPLVLGTRLSLAGLRGEAGDATGAADAFGQLLGDLRETLPDDHPYARWARRNLKHWKVKAGQDSGASGDELPVPAWVLGEKPSDMVALQRLVQWRRREGPATDAADLYEQLLGDMRRALGREHPYARWVYRNVDRSWGSGDARMPSKPRTKADKQLPTDRLLRKESPRTVAFQKLATMRRNGRDEAGAVEAYEQLLAERVRALGPDHSLVLVTRLNLAGLRSQAGDAAGATEESERLLAHMLRTLGEDHPFVLFTRLNLTGLRGEAGDGGQATEGL